MKKILIAAVLACSIGQASASTIEVTFTGTAYAIKSAFNSEGYYQPLGGLMPFSADFIFDTDLGALGDHRLDKGLVSAFITTDTFGSWGSPGWAYSNSFLTWNDDFSSVVAYTGITGSYIFLGISSADLGGGNQYGSFQFGLCPTHVGGPCGQIRSVDSMTITGFTGVPVPLVGTGLPGLLLAGGLLVWWRRKVS